MALFFPSKPQTPPASTPLHTSGHVTASEFKRDVMGRLRRDGMNEQERAIVESAAEGHMDGNGFMSSGMSYREKEELVSELRDGASKLGLEKKDVDRIDDALNRSL